MRAVSAVARIARVLLAHPNNEPVALSNTALASLAKTTDRNVRRCITQLRDAGAIEIRKATRYDRTAGHRLLVPNHEKLRAILDDES